MISKRNECKSKNIEIVWDYGAYTIVDECAAAVKRKGGKFFAFGRKSPFNKTNVCWMESTKSAECKEGFKFDGQRSFYALGSKPTKTVATGWRARLAAKKAAAKAKLAAKKKAKVAVAVVGTRSNCKSKCYSWDEGKTGNRCKNPCDCDGSRTCSGAGWCSGNAGSKSSCNKAPVQARETERDFDDAAASGLGSIVPVIILVVLCVCCSCIGFFVYRCVKATKKVVEEVADVVEDAVEVKSSSSS